MIVTKKSEPARFPQKVMNQWRSILKGLIRRWIAATVVNIKDPVQRSDPVRTIMVRPYGKTRAASVRIRPGAFSWYHGDVIVDRRVAQAKDRDRKSVV